MAQPAATRAGFLPLPPSGRVGDVSRSEIEGRSLLSQDGPAVVDRATRFGTPRDARSAAMFVPFRTRPGALTIISASSNETGSGFGGPLEGAAKCSFVVASGSCKWIAPRIAPRIAPCRGLPAIRVSADAAATSAGRVRHRRGSWSRRSLREAQPTRRRRGPGFAEQGDLPGIAPEGALPRRDGVLSFVAKRRLRGASSVRCLGTSEIRAFVRRPRFGCDARACGSAVRSRRGRGLGNPAADDEQGAEPPLLPRTPVKDLG